MQDLVNGQRCTALVYLARRDGRVRSAASPMRVEWGRGTWTLVITEAQWTRLRPFLIPYAITDKLDVEVYAQVSGNPSSNHTFAARIDPSVVSAESRNGWVTISGRAWSGEDSG